MGSGKFGCLLGLLVAHLGLIECLAGAFPVGELPFGARECVFYLFAQRGKALGSPGGQHGFQTGDLRFELGLCHRLEFLRGGGVHRCSLWMRPPGASGLRIVEREKGKPLAGATGKGRSACNLPGCLDSPGNAPTCPWCGGSIEGTFARSSCASDPGLLVSPEATCPKGLRMAVGEMAPWTWRTRRRPWRWSLRHGAEATKRGNLRRWKEGPG